MSTRRVALPHRRPDRTGHAARAVRGASGRLERRVSRRATTATTVTPKARKPKVTNGDNCPTKQWTVPLELKGLACILLLPEA